MIINYSLTDIQQNNIPWSIQDVLNDEYIFVMEQINQGKFDYLGSRIKIPQDKEKIKSLVIKRVLKMANKYDIHWDYEKQFISQKYKKVLNKVVKNIKTLTKYKNFKVSTVYLNGDIGVYIAKSVFKKTQIGIDFEQLMESIEENPNTDLESELYKTIFHELKHSEQDLENRLQVNDKSLEDEAEDHGYYMFTQIKSLIV